MPVLLVYFMIRSLFPAVSDLQPPESDGRPDDVIWFWRFLIPVFLSTVALCLLRMMDCVYVKTGFSLLGSLEYFYDLLHKVQMKSI